MYLKSPTRYVRVSLLLLTILALVTTAIVPQVSIGVSVEPSAEQTATPKSGKTAASTEAFGRLPLSFEENRGQLDSQVRFVARGKGFGLFLTGAGAVFSFSQSTKPVRMRFPGSSTAAEVSGVGELPGKANYFLGNKPEAWQTNVPTYERVRYQQVYPGVDLIYYGNQQQLEYDFVVAPGVNVKQIRVAFEGAGKPKLNRNGDLVLKTQAGDVTLHQPKAFQDFQNERRAVSVKYAVNGRGEVSFQVGKYDRSRELVIDPVLAYSTFLGGTSQDNANAIVLDSSGNVYIVGNTASTNFPTASPIQAVNAGGLTDVFVAKLNSTGSALVYSTYLGGNGNDTGLAIAIDAAGNAYIAGQTGSVSFPTANALHSGNSGSTDAFAAELNASGSALVYSTYLGGGSADTAVGIAVDAAGNTYVAGSTASRDFPTTNPFQASRQGNMVFKSTNGGGNWAASDNGMTAGAANDLVFQPGSTTIMYAATDTGLFKSTDSGATWSKLAGQTNLPIQKLAIDPTNTSIIYAGTASGIFKSTDGGASFNALNTGFAPIFTTGILIDPVTPANLYAFTFGNQFFKSTDGGQNWTPIFIDFNVALINDMVLDANNPSVVYAATNLGVYKSTNGGQNWTLSNNGIQFPSGNSLAFDKTNNLVYVGTNTSIYKSSDGAANWTNIGGNLNNFIRFNKITPDPANTQVIYALTTFGLQKTVDGGTTWNAANSGLPSASVTALILNPGNTAMVYLAAFSNADAYLTKFGPGGAPQIYSTYLGGTGQESVGGVAVDSTGQAYIVGTTASSNFPTANALQPALNIVNDVFVTKFNAAGSALVYSTFLGGDGNDVGRAIALDASNNVYIAGTTSSPLFPTVNPYQSTPGAQFGNDGFVSKINSAGSALVYSTYLGGDGNDDCFAIAVDSAGSAYVTGTTNSLNFPAVGALQPARGGNNDAFVTKLAPNGSTLNYSTYLGGVNNENGFGIAVDSSKNVYVAGSTASNDFPTLNALQPARAGSTDVFITKLKPAPDLEVTMTDSPDPVAFGSDLTYMINVKNNGDATATGVTLSDTLPAGSIFVSANTTVGTCNGTTTVNCNIGTLTASAGATVTIVIKPPAVRTINNTATGALTETDTLTSNNSATVSTLVDFADLTISKNVAQDLVAAGGKVTYALIAKNKSGVPAQVTVTDNLPPGVSFVKCSVTGNGVCGGNGNNVTVDFPQLAVGASEAIVLTVQVGNGVANGTVISNTASIQSTLQDPTPGDNSASANFTVAAVTVLPKANGRIAFNSDRAGQSNPKSGIYTIKPDGTDEQLFPNTPFNARRPVWSPDGTKLAYLSPNFGGSSVVTELNVINADGTGFIKIANNVSDFNHLLSWSPNGKQIAYIGNQLGNINLVRTVNIANVDGSGSYILPGSPTFLTGVDYSPDGSKFVYATDREIFVMNGDATGQTQLTTMTITPDGQTSDIDPRWSPDGTKIVLNRFTNNFTEIWVMNADGSNLHKIFNFAGRLPSWSPDGLTIVLEQFGDICSANLDGTNFKCFSGNGFNDAAPDWQKLPNASPTPTPSPVPTFSISGSVTSSNGPLFLQVTLTGPVNASVNTDNLGNYQFVNLPAGQYTITPVSIFFNFAPVNRTVTISNANFTGQDFVGTFFPANITGHVKDNNGNPIVGIKVTSVGGFPEGTTFTDATGFYSFPNVQRNRTYSISVDPFTAYNFNPSSKIISNLQQSEVVDFVGTKLTTNVIAGRLVEGTSGLGIGGVQVSLAQGINFAASTFTDGNGNFSFGDRPSNNPYSVSVQFTQTFIFEPVFNAPNPFAQIQIPNLTSDQNLTFTGSRRNTVLFTNSTPSTSEGSGQIEIIVIRAGDSTSPATVNYSTSDTAGLTACTVINGKASDRCDYGTAAGTLRFIAGETAKSFWIPIVDDAHVEGAETFLITLSNPVGAQIGSPSVATVTITDNDAAPATQNPIDGVQPFVTQQYIDFLGRLPDSVGLANWMATLGGCPNGGFGENLNPDCDRVHVSSGFFLSDEFRGRGYWAYRWYEVGLDRRPLYSEFMPDMAQVGGPQSPQSEALSKATYTDDFVKRTEFVNKYNGMSNSAYVNALEQNAEITLANKADLVAALNGNQKTRAQVLREIVELKAVEDRFFIRAFVAMQYFGYLRRDPDTIGYANWVDTLTADPSNFRHMIFGFLFSTEYRGRFGP